MLDTPSLPIYTPEQLIAFEREIADAFNASKIRAPVHLSGGNEAQLIEIFKEVEPENWVFSTWRSHYHCLLKGVPPQRVKEDILAGHSITLNYKDQRVVTSAIVGGICPIALGVAWSIKRNGNANHVWVFVGDMTARTGIFYECQQYAAGFQLPITFVVEDNGKSVCTDTNSVWGTPEFGGFTSKYRYVLPYPHSGAGKRVNF